MVSFFVTLGRMVAVFIRGLKDPEFRALFIFLVGLVISGTVFFGSVEGWGIVDAVYFSVMTLSTVGCDDLHPTTDVSKIFTVVYLVFGVGVFARFIVMVASQQGKRHHFRQAGGDHS